MIDIDGALNKLESIVKPEDIFGYLGKDKDSQLKSLREKYLELAKSLHPDRNAGSDNASKALSLLNRFKELAETKIGDDTYGKKTTSTITIGKNIYEDLSFITTGDICDIYQARLDSKNVLLKILRDQRDRDLIINETKVLTELHSKTDKEALHFRRYLPTLIESSQITDGFNRNLNVFKLEENCYTLTYILNKYKDGLDARHSAWIWKRLLECLDWVHRMGFIHCAINPDHVLVFPTNHGVQLLDWSYTTKIGQKAKAIPTGTRSVYPSDLLDKEPVTTGVDLYLIGNVIKQITNNLPRKYEGLIHACQLPKNRRYQDAFEVKEELKNILRSLFGPAKFVELNI